MAEGRLVHPNPDVVTLNPDGTMMNINQSRKIFVFGSNLAGRHDKGAAKTALKRYGAVYGQGTGLQGNSYAIPTKDENLKTLSLSSIEWYIRNQFIPFAQKNPNLTFVITPIGCGLAGYKQEQIRPFFADAPLNCIFHSTWRI